MNITGNVNLLSLNNIRFENLKGVENRCQESLKDFEEGDKIIVISLGEYKNNGIELNDGIYFVKKDVANDFIIRFLQSINQEIVKPIENH